MIVLILKIIVIVLWALALAKWLYHFLIKPLRQKKKEN
jgi:hypothetical protein